MTTYVKYIKEGNVPSGTAPSFTTQPSAATVTEGATAQFMVATTGTPTITYQWQVNDGSWRDVTGSDGTGGTTDTFTTVATTTGMSTYQYRCVATNGVGSTTSNAAVLTVNASSFVAPATQEWYRADLSTGAVYYLDPDSGSDSNTGLSEAQAFQTWARARSEAVPGVTIKHKPGTYVVANNPQFSLPVDGTGNPGDGNWITVMPYNVGERVRYEFPSHDNAYGWQLVGRSRIQIYGFELIMTDGDNVNSSGNWEGAFIAGNTYGTVGGPGQSIWFANCGAQGWAVGIHLLHARNSWAAGCWATRCAQWSTNGSSGFSYNSADPAAVPTSELLVTWFGKNYRGGFIDCYSWDNFQHYPSSALPGWSTQPSDGNGFILSDNNVERDPAPWNGSKDAGPFLIYNCLAVGNGGRGIENYDSPNTDIINCTTYHNGKHNEYAGQPGFTYSSARAGTCLEIGGLNTGSTLYNSVMIADASNSLGGTLGKPSWSNATGGSNLHVNVGTSDHQFGTDSITTGTNPGLNNPGLDPLTNDFRPSASAPLVIDQGVNTFSAGRTDFSGNARQQGAATDRGVYERTP